MKPIYQKNDPERNSIRRKFLHTLFLPFRLYSRLVDSSPALVYASVIACHLTVIAVAIGVASVSSYGMYELFPYNYTYMTNEMPSDKWTKREMVLRFTLNTNNETNTKRGPGIFRNFLEKHREGLEFILDTKGMNLLSDAGLRELESMIENFKSVYCQGCQVFSLLTLLNKEFIQMLKANYSRYLHPELQQYSLLDINTNNRADVLYYLQKMHLTRNIVNYFLSRDGTTTKGSAYEHITRLRIGDYENASCCYNNCTTCKLSFGEALKKSVSAGMFWDVYSMDAIEWGKVSPYNAFLGVFLSIGSLAVAFVAVCLYTHSVFIALSGFLSMLSSFLLTTFVYRYALKLSHFTFFHVTAMHLTFPLTVDGILALFESWRFARHLGAGTIGERVENTYRGSFTPMLLVTLGSMIEFLCLLGTDHFVPWTLGTFSSIRVVLNFFSILVTIPPAIAVYHLYLDKIYGERFAIEGQNGVPHVTWLSQFMKYALFYTISHRIARHVLVGVSLVLTLALTLCIPNLRFGTAMDSEPLRDSEVPERALVSKLLPTSVEPQVVIYLLWGRTEEDVNMCRFDEEACSDDISRRHLISLGSGHVRAGFQDLCLKLEYQCREQATKYLIEFDPYTNQPNIRCFMSDIEDYLTAGFNLPFPWNKYDILAFWEMVYGKSDKSKEKLKEELKVNNWLSIALPLFLKFNADKTYRTEGLIQGESSAESSCFSMSHGLSNRVTVQGKHTKCKMYKRQSLKIFQSNLTKIHRQLQIMEPIVINASVCRSHCLLDNDCDFTQYHVSKMNCFLCKSAEDLGKMKEDTDWDFGKKLCAPGVPSLSAVTVVAVKIETKANPRTINVGDAIRLAHLYEALVTDMGKTVTELRRGFPATHSIWTWAFLQQSLWMDAIRGMLAGIISSLILFFLGTFNLLTPLLGTITMALSLLCVLGTAALLNWKIEMSLSISLCMMNGLSVRFIVYLLHAYRTSFETEREERTQSAMERSGPPVLVSSIVFLCCTFIMTFAPLRAIHVPGAILCLAGTFNIVFLLTFLLPLLTILGPEGSFLDLRHVKKWLPCRLRCDSGNFHRETSPIILQQFNQL